MKNRKPILVTGSHRSGSTWVGKMIALSPSVGYIKEPFNLEHRPGICSAKFDHWFTYITQENESQFYGSIDKTIRFSYNFQEEVKAINSWKDILRLLRDYSNFYQYRISHARPLLKDPIAVFSAEWLAEKFDMDVVVLIRHPAAFVSSFKKKNWSFDFSHLLKQPLLMEKHLYPFETEIKESITKEYDAIDQASLLWKLIYHVVGKYRDDHKDWIFTKHEDISLNPIASFQMIFNHLNLNLSNKTKKAIEKYSSSQNPSEITKNENIFYWLSNRDLKCDSKANIVNWQNRLSQEEISRIRVKTEEVAYGFYLDRDWNM